MCEMVELGLSRNRAFEPYSAVIFSGKYKEKFNADEVNKAFRLLLEKEPILSCAVEFGDNGKVFLVKGKVEPKVVFSQKKENEIISLYSKQGLDISEKLFEFYVTEDDFLVIISHTAVADGKSLLRLAKSFVTFYEKKSISIEANSVNAFSSFLDLPVDIASPLTDKLAANLDEKWNKKPKNYDVNDYKKLQFECSVKETFIDELSATISSEDMGKIKMYCEEESVDVSSVVGFAFYKALLGKMNGDKKFERFVVSSDRRFFMTDSSKYSVGAFDGSVEISLGKKERRKDLTEQLKAFHLAMYKGVTSVFKSFYDDVLLMKVEPSYCHSAYMYAFGFNKNKASQKLAESYSCLCEKMCKYSFCNLEQTYWCELQNFSDISVRDAVRLYSSTALNLVMAQGEGKLIFRFRSDKVTPAKAQSVLDEVLITLQSFKK